MADRALVARKRIVEREKSLMEATVRNPFVHRLNLTTLDKIQIAVMSVTIVPIRLVMIGLMLLLGWGLARISLMGRTKEDEKEPLTGWRNSLRPLVVFFCRAVFFMGGFHWVSYKGTRAPPEEAMILATAPHSGFFDSLPATTFGLISVVAKATLEHAPIFGTLTCFTQPVFVSREDPNSRQTTIQEIKRRAKSGGKWPQIIIFPEGTCTNRTCLITYKQGAFFPGVPVQPVILRYNNRLDTITWTWEGPTAFMCLWYTLCQFNTNVEVEFLPVYSPSQEEKENPRLFADNVRAVSAKALGVPVTDHTFEDCRLMNYAAKLDMPAAAGLLEFSKISKKLGFNFDNIKEMLEKFCLIAQKSEGHITIEKFSEYLHVPITDDLTDLFELYDRDGSGTIDFREYVIGLSLITQPAYSEETLQLAFKLFDHGGKGHITQEELRDILEAAYGIDEVDVPKLFANMDINKNGKISYEDFVAYAKTKPEYAKLFEMTGSRDKNQVNSSGSSIGSSTNSGTNSAMSNGQNGQNGETHKADRPVTPKNVTSFLKDSRVHP